MKTRTILMAVIILGMAWSCGNKKESATNTEKNLPKSTLHEAAFFGDLDAVKQHVEAGTDANKKDEYGSTPLNVAITFGKTDVALALLDATDLTIASPDGSTPLHAASFFGRTSVVKALLSKGVDINAKNNYGSTPLASASAPFEQVKPIYDQLSRDLGPLGFKLNYEQLKASRAEIAKLLKEAGANQ